MELRDLMTVMHATAKSRNVQWLVRAADHVWFGPAKHREDARHWAQLALYGSLPTSGMGIVLAVDELTS